MKCWLQHVESPKPWFCEKNPLGFVLLSPLLPMWGPTQQWEMNGLQAPSLQPQIGRRFLNHPLVTPNQMGELHAFSDGPWEYPVKAAHGGLCQEVALKELNAPPGTHCWVAGGLQWEMETLMWMTRRSPSQERGDGNPETTTLTHCPPWWDEDIGHHINTLATRL